MTAYQPAAPASPVDDSGVVVTDLPCRKCAYNLRTLSINSRCPECGTAVGYSAQGDLLRFSDPTWVMNLHRGVVMILSAIAVVVVGVILTAVVDGVRARGTAELLGALVILAGYLLYVVGSWLLTEPDPSGLGEQEYGTARKVIRVTLIIGVLDSLLDVVDLGFTVPPGLSSVFLIFTTLAGIASVVGTFAQLQYVGKLATRIPDEKVTRRAHFLKWAFAVSYGAIILGTAIVALIGPGTGGASVGGGVIGVGCFMGLAVLALLVFSIMYLLMLDRLRKALKEQAQYALHTWAGSGAAAPAA
jgi:hypothetical protein